MSYYFDMHRDARSSRRNPGQNEAVIAVLATNDRPLRRFCRLVNAAASYSPLYIAAASLPSYANSSMFTLNARNGCMLEAKEG